MGSPAPAWMRATAAVIAALLAGLVVLTAVSVALHRGPELVVHLSTDGRLPNVWDLLDKRPVIASVVAATVAGVLVWRRPGRGSARPPEPGSAADHRTG